MTRQIHLRTCPLCEAMCGLEVHVEDEQVALIRPDRDDVWSRGFICPKGTTLGHLHHDPDRLRAPLVREGDQWREVGWDEAFARCEELLSGVVERHGKEAVRRGQWSIALGNPVEGNPQSRKLAVAIAPWSCMFSVSRKQAMPDNFAAATRNPARVACWDPVGRTPSSQGPTGGCALWSYWSAPEPVQSRAPMAGTRGHPRTAARTSRSRAGAASDLSPWPRPPRSRTAPAEPLQMDVSGSIA